MYFQGFDWISEQQNLQTTNSHMNQIITDGIEQKTFKIHVRNDVDQTIKFRETAPAIGPVVVVPKDVTAKVDYVDKDRTGKLEFEAVADENTGSPEKFLLNGKPVFTVDEQNLSEFGEFVVVSRAGQEWETTLKEMKEKAYRNNFGVSAQGVPGINMTGAEQGGSGTQIGTGSLGGGQFGLNNSYTIGTQGGVSQNIGGTQIIDTSQNLGGAQVLGGQGSIPQNIGSFGNGGLQTSQSKQTGSNSEVATGIAPQPVVTIQEGGGSQTSGVSTLGGFQGTTSQTGINQTSGGMQISGGNTTVVTGGGLEGNSMGGNILITGSDGGFKGNYSTQGGSNQVITSDGYLGGLNGTYGGINVSGGTFTGQQVITTQPGQNLDSGIASVGAVNETVLTNMGSKGLDGTVTKGGTSGIIVGGSSVLGGNMTSGSSGNVAIGGQNHGIAVGGAIMNNPNRTMYSGNTVGDGSVEGFNLGNQGGIGVNQEGLSGNQEMTVVVGGQVVNGSINHGMQAGQMPGMNKGGGKGGGAIINGTQILTQGGSAIGGDNIGVGSMTKTDGGMILGGANGISQSGMTVGGNTMNISAQEIYSDNQMSFGGNGNMTGGYGGGIPTLSSGNKAQTTSYTYHEAAVGAGRPEGSQSGNLTGGNILTGGQHMNVYGQNVSGYPGGGQMGGISIGTVNGTPVGEIGFINGSTIYQGLSPNAYMLSIANIANESANLVEDRIGFSQLIPTKSTVSTSVVGNGTFNFKALSSKGEVLYIDGQASKSVDESEMPAALVIHHPGQKGVPSASLSLIFITFLTYFWPMFPFYTP